RRGALRGEAPGPAQRDHRFHRARRLARAHDLGRPPSDRGGGAARGTGPLGRVRGGFARHLRRFAGLPRRRDPGAAVGQSRSAAAHGRLRHLGGGGRAGRRPGRRRVVAVPGRLRGGPRRGPRGGDRGQRGGPVPGAVPARPWPLDRHGRRRTWTLGTPPSSEEAGTASSASSASPAPSSRGPAGADEADAGADEAHGRLRPHRPRSSACEPAPDLRPRGEGPGSNGRYPFGSDPPGPAADADEADEAIPHSSNGGAWESSRGPAGAADEADAPIPGFSDEGGAWDWERVTEAMYREYVAWRNATPAAWGWPPTSPEARAAAAWDDAYAAGDLGRLRRAHAACLACRAEPAEPVSRPPG